MWKNNYKRSPLDGENDCLIGPSGCGKSTLLNMISLLGDFDNGKIRIFGKEIPGIKSRKATMLWRNTVNYLFQSSELVGDMTVYQNLMLAMHFVRISQKEKEIRINRMLHEGDLSKMRNAVVNTMSGGEQQRVALAGTLLKPGKLILADEPTGALDEKSAERVFLLLRALYVQYKKTVIMVTHNMELRSSNKPIIFSSVDFPHPDGPIRAVISPSLISILI